VAAFVPWHGSDPNWALLAEVSALAGTAASLQSVGPFAARDGDNRCDRTMALFLDHRVATHLFKQLTLSGLDLRELTVARAVWERCSTSGVVPELARRSDGRIPLRSVFLAMAAHRALQWDIVASLASAFTGAFLVMFGQGIAVAHPGYSERFSHDIDLLVPDSVRGRALVGALRDLGFQMSNARSVNHDGREFHDWRLDAPDFHGHRMHVDISSPGVANTNGWRRPFMVSNVFETSREIQVGPGCLGGSGHSIFVPSDTHQLLLVCEKAQRRLRYDARVRCDATVLVRDGEIDGRELIEISRGYGLTATLRWALGTSALKRSVAYEWRGALCAGLIPFIVQSSHAPPAVQRTATGALKRLWR
jgi:hypothetical protein